MILKAWQANALLSGFEDGNAAFAG